MLNTFCIFYVWRISNHLPRRHSQVKKSSGLCFARVATTAFGLRGWWNESQARLMNISEIGSVNKLGKRKKKEK